MEGTIRSSFLSEQAGCERKTTKQQKTKAQLSAREWACPWTIWVETLSTSETDITATGIFLAYTVPTASTAFNKAQIRPYKNNEQAHITAGPDRRTSTRSISNYQG
jgi:hypothetical protein